MAQQIKLKRSAVAGRIPTTSNLSLGEIAINTEDGKLFFQRGDSTIQSFFTTNALITGSLQQSGSDSYFLSNVGIGTDSPSKLLTVGSSTGGSGTADSIAAFYGQHPSTPGLLQINYDTDGSGETSVKFGGNGTITGRGGIFNFNTSGKTISFAVNSEINSNQANAAFYISGSGDAIFQNNVGIGTTTPSQALTVEGSISASGAIYDNIGSPGTSGQMIQSTGTGYIWTDNVAESAQDLIISGKNMTGSTIAKGTPLYFSGSNTAGNIVGVYPADAGNPDRMPAGGVAAAELASDAEGDVYIYGYINGVNTSAFNSGDDVYVAVGGGYTNVKPTGSALIQKLGNVEKVDASNGSGVINGPSWYNDLPNWEEGKIKVGRSDGQPVTSSFVHLDETNGRLGIGTDTPNAELEVKGNIRLYTSTNTITFLNQNVGLYRGGNNLKLGGYDNIIFEVSNNIVTQQTERMRLTSDGRLGIGTTSPLSWTKLHVAGHIYTDDAVTSDGYLRVRGTGQADKVIISGTNSSYFNGGNVGIGTNLPSARLHVKGSGTNSSTTAFRIENANASASLVVNDYGNVAIGGTPSTSTNRNLLITGPTGSLTVTGSLSAFGAAFTDPVTIYDPEATENPRLSVGRSETQSLNFDVEDRIATIFHKQDETSGNQALRFEVHNDSPTKYFQFGFRDTDGTNHSIPLHISSSGNVGIGTLTPTQALTVEGSISASGDLYVRGDLTVGKISNETKLVDVGGNFNFNPVNEPTPSELSGFSATLAGAGAGNVNNGVHYYHVIFKTAAGGETGAYNTPYASVTVSDNSSNGKVQLTGIPTSTDPRVTARDIYRTEAGSNQYFGRKLATISDNTTTTYLDNLADSSLDLTTQFYRKRNTTAGLLYSDNTLFAQAPNIYYTSFGVQALQDVTTGHSIVAIGGNALQSVTSGNDNTGVGYNAGAHLVDGGVNTYIGNSSGEYNEGGTNNVNVGSYAGRLQSLGDVAYNSYLGSSAGYKTVGGNNYNVGIGYRAGYGFQGTGNINIGPLSGYKSTPEIVGNYNIQIGYNSGKSTTGTRNILIGYQNELADPTASQRLNIGNLIYGTNLGTGTTISSGNVGIRVAAPQAPFHVRGNRFLLERSGSNDATIEVNTTDAGAYFKANSEGASGYYGLELNHDTTAKWFIGSYGSNSLEFVRGAKSTGTRSLVIDSSNRVGIGVPNPGDFNSSAANLVVGNGAGSNGITIYSGIASAGGLYFADASGSGAGNRDGVVNYNHSTATMEFKTGGNQKVFSISTGTSTFHMGNVVMENDLIVKGRVTAEEFHTEFVSASIIYQSGSTKFGDTQDDTHSFTGSLELQSGSYRVENFEEGIQWFNGTNYTSNKIKLSSAQNLQIQAGGIIQLQSSTQVTNGRDFILNNTDNTTRFNINNAGSSGEYRLDFSSGSTELMVISGSGNVGIGTTSPQQKLHVAGTTRVDGDFFIISADPVIHFSDTNNNSDYNINVNGGLFKINDATNNVARITLNSSGNVGIGTTAPSEELHVNGNVAIEGTAKVVQGAKQVDGDPAGAIMETFDGNQYIGAFLDYTVYDDSLERMRSGTIQMVFNPSGQVRFTDNSTTDIGDSSPATFQATASSPNAVIKFVAPNSTWHVRYHVRYL